MTSSEMHTYFKILFDKTDSLNYPQFLPEEVDIWLNIAQDKFIEQRAYGNNPRREGLEETQKRQDDIRNVIKNFSTSTFTTSANNKTNGRFISLPADYRHAIEEEILVSYTDCHGTTQQKRVEVLPTTHDRFNRTVDDPFNKPYEDLVVRLVYEGNTFELVTDGVVTPVTYYLRYIKTPQRIQYGSIYSTPTTNVDCELATHTHIEIIKLAVQEALENIQSQRLQSNTQILNTSE